MCIAPLVNALLEHFLCCMPRKRKFCHSHWKYLHQIGFCIMVTKVRRHNISFKLSNNSSRMWLIPFFMTVTYRIKIEGKYMRKSHFLTYFSRKDETKCNIFIFIYMFIRKMYYRWSKKTSKKSVIIN